MPFSSLWRIRSVPMLAGVVTMKPALPRISTQAVQHPQLMSFTTWMVGALAWAVAAKGAVAARLAAEMSRRRRDMWVIYTVLLITSYMFVDGRRGNATECRCRCRCRCRGAGSAFPHWPEGQQPERVERHDHGGASIGEDRDPEARDAQKSRHQEHRLEAQGNGDVLTDVGQGRAGKPDQPRNVSYPVAQDGGMCGLQRHVGARAHGHANLRGGKRRGVIDPVANHHHLRLLSEIADLAHLVFRQKTRAVVDPETHGNRCGRARVVAGQHHRHDAQGTKLAHGFGRVGARLVAQSDQAASGLVAPDVYNRLSLRLEHRGLGTNCLAQNTALFRQPGRANRHSRAMYHGLGALARDGAGRA